jgi:hypothetical protein
VPEKDWSAVTFPLTVKCCPVSADGETAVPEPEKDVPEAEMDPAAEMPSSAPMAMAPVLSTRAAPVFWPLVLEVMEPVQGPSMAPGLVAGGEELPPPPPPQACNAARIRAASIGPVHAIRFMTSSIRRGRGPAPASCPTPGQRQRVDSRDDGNPGSGRHMRVAGAGAGGSGLD